MPLADYLKQMMGGAAASGIGAGLNLFPSPQDTANAGMMPAVAAPAAPANPLGATTPVDDSMPDPATVNPPGMDAVPPDQVDYSASPGGPNSLGDPGPFPKKNPPPPAAQPTTDNAPVESGAGAGSAYKRSRAANASSEASYNAAQAAAQQYYANAPNAANLGYGAARVSGYGAPVMTGGGLGSLGGGLGGLGGGFPNLGSINAGGGAGGAAGSAGSKFQGPTPPDITGSNSSSAASGASGSAQQPVSAAMAAYLNNPGGQFNIPANAIKTNADGTASVVNPGGTNGAGQAATTGTGGTSGSSSGSVAGSGGSGGSASTSPGGLLGQLSQTYQDAMNQANQANSQLAGQLMGGYGQLLGGASSLLGNVTNQQYQNLANLRDQQKAAATQDLTNRGLGNSTIKSSVESGINNQYAQNYNNLQDQRINDALGLLTGIGGQQLQTLNSFNLNAPNYGTLAALAQSLGTSGQNPNSASSVGGTPGASVSNYTQSYQPTTNLNALPSASGGVSSTNPAAAATAGTNGTGFTVPTIDFAAEMGSGLGGILQSNAGQSTPQVANQGYYGLPGPQAASGPSGAQIANYVNYLQQNGQQLPAWLQAGYGTG